MTMHENEIAKEVVDAAYRVHSHLGPGLLESYYAAALRVELDRKRLRTETEVRFPVTYRGKRLDVSFRADLIVDGSVLVEIKATETTHPIHRQQVLTYLRVTGLHLGLLVNFGAPTIKRGVSRVVNGLPE